jgi:DNA repair exonuclease SbcCD ATPase subunit
MSAAPDPLEPAALGGPEISQAAQLARERLHEEIERVRLGVEEMLGEQGSGRGEGSDIRGELDELRIETRNFVKKKVRKSEKKLERSMRELGARTDELEQRVGEVEAGREAAEVRIHNDTERMLDELLREVRTIADRLSGHPAPVSPAPR